jgi:putative transposase
MREVTKCAPQQAIKNLGAAYANYVSDIEKARRGELSWKRVRKPKLKRKGYRDAFRAHNGPEKNRPVKTAGKRIKLPKVGWVKMREALRFTGRILSVTVSRQADQWYVSLAVDTELEMPMRSDLGMVACDLGITSLATMFDGKTVQKEQGRKPLTCLLRRVRRLDKALSRKAKRSRNWVKAKTKLARLHVRIANIRRDAMHKLTTGLVRKYRFIAIEDLHVAGILANRHVALAVSDLAFGELRRQLKYKSLIYDSNLLVIDRWYPSSKLCSTCSIINKDLGFGIKQWECPNCAAQHDRDENAARNLYNAASSAVSACGAKSAGPAELSLGETVRWEAGRFADANRDGQEVVGSTALRPN